MKPFIFALLLWFPQFTIGSELRLERVFLPLYLHGSDEDSRISIREVPFMTFEADPEWRFPAIAKPFLPPAGGTLKSQDVNLASVYRIAIIGTYKGGGKDMAVTIDASKAVQPEGYPFTVEQVIDAVTTCVKLMYPPQPSEDGALEITVARPAKKSK